MLISEIRNAVAFAVGAVVFYADLVAACALGLLYGLVSAEALGLLWALAVMSTAAVGGGVWCILRAVPRSRPLKKRLEGWASRVDDWITQPIAGHPVVPVPVTHPVLLHGLAPADVAPPPVVPSRSTLPRALEPWELTGWVCWRCGGPAVKGTHAWDDRGPGQLLSNHALECRAGHRWTNSTDGG
ncbi:hypothetical protein ACIO6T_37900 [Streptomyces sp. NPDC087532]|uniref:hypothetical protein n=1 Tax=Streptomyces sp. NPDC087532 TaxID=3365795 RepID=UPI00380666C0